MRILQRLALKAAFNDKVLSWNKHQVETIDQPIEYRAMLC